MVIMQMDLVLASTSPYRQQLLKRLRLPFRSVPPQTDETPHPGESPSGLARRLARAKARSVAELYPGAVVIGSDQVAAIDGSVLHKPGSFEIAAEQLRRASGREVHFYTAIALLCIEKQFDQFHVEPFTARFRSLSESQISHYLHQDEPYDCAGSFKVESLGIALFEGLVGNDPTSLEGLPLIRLTGMLGSLGIDVLGA
jgi:septum formation protein